MLLTCAENKSNPHEISVQARIYEIGASKPALRIDSRPGGRRRDWEQVREGYFAGASAEAPGD